MGQEHLSRRHLLGHGAAGLAGLAAVVGAGAGVPVAATTARPGGAGGPTSVPAAVDVTDEVHAGGAGPDRDPGENRRAIASAVAALAGRAGTLVIPSGRYRVAPGGPERAVLVLHDGVEVRADPGATFVVEGAGDDACVVAGDGVRDVRISGLSIVGPGGRSARGPVGVWLRGAERVAVVGVRVARLGGHAVELTGDRDRPCRGVVVDRCHLEACGRSGVAVRAAVDLTVAATTIRACDRGVGLSPEESPVERVRLVANQIRGCRAPSGGGAGIDLGERPDLVRRVLLQANHLVGNAGPGVQGAARSLTVTANAFDGNAGGAVLLTGGTGVVVASTCTDPQPGRLAVPASGFVVQANQLVLDAGPAVRAGGEGPSSVVAHNAAAPVGSPPPVRVPRGGAATGGRASPGEGGSPASPGAVDIGDLGAVSQEDRLAGAAEGRSDQDVAEGNRLAVEAAMARIAERGGGTLAVPPGTFLVRPSPSTGTVLSPVSGTTIRFAPGAAFQVTLAGERRYFVIRARTCDASGCRDEPVEDVSIIGARLVGVRDPAVVLGHGVFLPAVRRLRIRDCHFSDMALDGVYLRSDTANHPTTDVVITSSVFERNGRTGLFLAGVDNVDVSGCTFRATAGGPQGVESGLVLEPPYRPLFENRNVRISGNRFEANGSMGLLVSQKHPNEAVVVVGNEIVDNGRWGVSLGNVGPRDGTAPESGRGAAAVLYANAAWGNNRSRDEGTDDAGALRITTPDAVVVANTAEDNLEHALWLHHQYVVQTEPGADGGGMTAPVRGTVAVANRLASRDEGTVGHRPATDLAANLVADNLLDGEG